MHTQPSHHALNTTPVRHGQSAAVFVCALSSSVSDATQGADRFQLLPAGKFRATDGRPASLKLGFDDWLMDAQALAACQSAASQRKNAYMVDFEHQTFYKEVNGQANPAAGWFTGFELTDTGLWATGVSWTKTTRESIAAGEFKYISAAFVTDADGRVTEIYNAALTNSPAVDGMSEVMLASLNASLGKSLGAQPSPDFLSTAGQSLPGNPDSLGEPPMNTLAMALGLAVGATEAQLLSSITTLQGQLREAQAGAFDPAKHIALSSYTELQNSFTALSAKVEGAERTALLNACLADGRIVAAQAEFWGKQPLVTLSEFAKTATPNPALAGKQQTQQTQVAGVAGVGGAGAALSPEALKIMQACGITAEAYTKAGPMRGMAQAEQDLKAA